MVIKLPFDAKFAVLEDVITGTCPKCHKHFPMEENKDPEDVVCPHCGFTYEAPNDYPPGSIV